MLGYASRVDEQSANRMLATGALMGAATFARAGLECLELWSQRLPPLLELGEDVRRGSGGEQAQGRFRDELVALARESSEIALRELRRGVEDLDAYTRPEEAPPSKPRRPYKAKR